MLAYVFIVRAHTHINISVREHTYLRACMLERMYVCIYKYVFVPILARAHVLAVLMCVFLVCVLYVRSGCYVQNYAKNK